MVGNMTYVSAPKQEEGGEQKTSTIDLSVKELLIEAVKTLRRIEYHLSILTATDISDEDI